MGPFPQSFGRYVLVEPLARGGMGHVALAITGRQGYEDACVVKRILPELRRVPEHVARFRHEAAVTLRLFHPNLVRTFDAGDIDGEPFIAQELVEGRALSQVLDSLAGLSPPRLPVPLAVHIVREIARGLAYAHDFEGLELVHRDVSPPNVHLGYDGSVRLMDFGLATSQERAFVTTPGIHWGRLAYMAPEQFTDARLDRRADLYALGVLLWELLAGRPFGSRVAPDGRLVLPDLPARGVMPCSVPDGGPPSAANPAVPSALDLVAARAVARAPEARFPTAGAFEAALAATLPSGPPGQSAIRTLLGDLFDVERERDYRARLIREASRYLAPPGPSAVPAAPVPAPTAAGRWRGAVVLGAVMAAVAAAIGLAFVPQRAREALPVSGADRVGGAPASHVVSAPLSRGPSPAARAPEARPASPTAVPPPPAPVRERADEPATRSPAATLDRARRAFAMADLAQALHLARQAAEQGAGSSAHLLMGNIHFKLRRLDEAEQDYQDALRLDAGNAAARERLDRLRAMRP